jgi:phosphoribosylformimino-5-aminoimidazole carboxamide ribotide isomerase
MREKRLLVIPAVDVLGDQAVRLEQGDYARVSVRAGGPLELVERFAAAGPELIHLVDLDGARTGTVRPELVRAAVAAAGEIPIQASGGIRSVADAEALLQAGAVRVVVGTAAFAGESALQSFADALGERLVVAVDVKDGEASVAGWRASSGLSVDEAVLRCAEAGVARIHCTAVDRDGTLAGPDLDLLRRVVELAQVPVLAAGGIGSEADLEALAQVGVEGAVVGRALLDGRLPIAAVATTQP